MPWRLQLQWDAQERFQAKGFSIRDLEIWSRDKRAMYVRSRAQTSQHRGMQRMLGVCNIGSRKRGSRFRYLL